MINGKDLRIGNWVYSNGFRSKVQVTLIGDMVYMDCEPIPLSPEIIFSLGFGGKYKSCGYNFRKGSVLLTSQDEDDEGNEIEDYVFHVHLDYAYEGIYYLHQLQNLYFALTGEELTYKTEI